MSSSPTPTNISQTQLSKKRASIPFPKEASLLWTGKGTSCASILKEFYVNVKTAIVMIAEIDVY